MVTRPVRLSTQSTVVSPTSNVRAFILPNICPWPPGLDYPRFAVELVLYVKGSVLAYLEDVVIKTPRGWPTYVAPVYVVDPPVARAQHLALIREPTHRASQMGTVVAHDGQLLRQLLDLGLRKPPFAPVLQKLRALAVPPGHVHGVDYLFRLGFGLLPPIGEGLLLGELYPVLLRRIRGYFEDGTYLRPVLGNVRLSLKIGLDRGVQGKNGGWYNDRSPDQRPTYAHRDEIAPGYRVLLQLCQTSTLLLGSLFLVSLP